MSTFAATTRCSALMSVAVFLILMSTHCVIMASSSIQDQANTTRVNSTDKDYKHVVACYFTEWSSGRAGFGRFTTKNVDPHLCTHIIYAFGKLANNHLVSFGGRTFKELTAMKKLNPDLKVLIGVGGWTAQSTNFSFTVARKSRRDEFLKNAIRFLRNNGLDGLDLDWEYPRGHNVKLFTTWCQELRAGFEQEAIGTGRPRLLLTAAVRAGSQAYLHYETALIAKELDYIFLMSYDFNGGWNSDRRIGFNSPFPSVQWSAEDWLKRGTPANKLVVGIPAYGRSFTLAGPDTRVGAPFSSRGFSGIYTREPGVLSYYEICLKIKGGWNVRWHKEASVPYAYSGNQWVGYDNQCSVQRKVEFVKSLGLAGAMVWSLDLDDFRDLCGLGAFPLISVINNLLLGKKTLDNPVQCNFTLSDVDKTFTTSSASDNSILTECPSAGHYGNPSNCGTYFVCPPNHKIPILMYCPSGLHFNKLSTVCDYPRLAGCERSITKPRQNSQTTPSVTMATSSVTMATSTTSLLTTRRLPSTISDATRSSTRQLNASSTYSNQSASYRSTNIPRNTTTKRAVSTTLVNTSSTDSTQPASYRSTNIPSDTSTKRPVPTTTDTKARTTEGHQAITPIVVPAEDKLKSTRPTSTADHIRCSYITILIVGYFFRVL